mgnify:CR=1 FL=1
MTGRNGTQGGSKAPRWLSAGPAARMTRERVTAFALDPRPCRRGFPTATFPRLAAGHAMTAPDRVPTGPRVVDASNADRAGPSTQRRDP